MNLFQTVAEIIDRREPELTQFLGDLVRIPCVNQGEPNTCIEGPVQEHVAAFMRTMQLDVTMHAYDREQVRPNVIGRWKGAGGGESLLLNAHADVVPVNDPEQWTTEPFGGIVKDGCVWGRGAVDDKSGIAAMIFAVRALQEAGVRLKGDVVLLSSVGEESNEGGTLGAGPAVRDMKDKPSFAVVAESTAAQDLDIEGPSMFFFELTVHGKAVHMGCRNMVIYPQPRSVLCGNEIGADAIQKSLPILDMFYRKERDWACNWHGGMVGSGGAHTFDAKGVGVFGINIFQVEGGGYLGAVPAKMTIRGSVLHDQSRNSEDVFEELKNSVMAIASTDSWLAANPPEIRLLKELHYWPGFRVELDHPGVIASEQAHLAINGYPVNPSGFKAVCDATYIQRSGIPAVVYGAGEAGHGVHGVDENVSVDKLKKTCKFFAGLILEWCGVAE